MRPRTIIRLARPLRAAIGAHERLPAGYDVDQYYEAQTASILALQQIKYLVQHLASRHDAALLARAVGMPNHINLR
jgi:hypothetical protein